VQAHHITGRMWSADCSTWTYWLAAEEYTAEEYTKETRVRAEGRFRPSCPVCGGSEERLSRP